MDRGSFLGVLLGFALLRVAIGLGPNPRIFFNAPSTVLVVGGIIASTMIRFPLDHVRYAFSIASRAFFTRAPALNPARTTITGLICGIRVEDIEDPLMREVRYLDKLIDELAKGRKMEKILRA